MQLLWWSSWGWIKGVLSQVLVNTVIWNSTSMGKSWERKKGSENFSESLWTSQLTIRAPDSGKSITSVFEGYLLLNFSSGILRSSWRRWTPTWGWGRRYELEPGWLKQGEAKHSFPLDCLSADASNLTQGVENGKLSKQTLLNSSEIKNNSLVKAVLLKSLMFPKVNTALQVFC